MDAYRIADDRHPIFDPGGAAFYGGRWTSVGKRVIYASESYAAAILEVLVHRNGPSLPKHHKSVHIFIPNELTIETLLPVYLPGWDDEDNRVSQAFGDEWFDSKRSPVLRVPSVVTRGPEFNIVLNTLHPQFKLIHADDPAPVVWDKRLATPHAKKRSKTEK
jgi:RES domain-containing protein